MMKSAGDLLSPSKMMKSAAGKIGRKKGSARPFKEFYGEWIDALKTTLLPLLRHSMASASAALLHPSNQDLPVTSLGGAMVSSSDLLSTHVQTVHRHFQAYFQALDLAARHDVSQLLYPEWRNSLEKPFLWLGDFHPSLFTHLLRSFLIAATSDDSDSDDDDDSDQRSDDDDPSPFSCAWKNPSRDLISRVEQIERGLRLMVPALIQRVRDAQTGFVEGVAGEWVASKGGTGREDAASSSSSPPPPKASDETARAVTEELTGVFSDANRLRRSILSEIVGATDVYQAALYLEALSQFVVGFRDDDLLHDFEQCKMTLSPGSS